VNSHDLLHIGRFGRAGHDNLKHLLFR
jgi:hypothetical protein